MGGIGDCHYTLHLVLDVREGWFAVDHLVKNTSQTPDIARFAKFHDFPLGMGSPEGRRSVRVDKRFRGHVVRSSDMLFAMDVNSVISDGI